MGFLRCLSSISEFFSPNDCLIDFRLKERTSAEERPVAERGQNGKKVVCRVSPGGLQVGDLREFFFFDFSAARVGQVVRDSTTLNELQRE